MEKIEKEIIKEIKDYDWIYLGKDGFYEDLFLYNFRHCWQAIKKIREWQYKLNNVENK